MVLSQSYVLGGLIRKSSQQSTQQLLVLETDDPWVRPDGFYMACQRLYGLPLLELPPPRRSADSDNVTAAGSLAERFNFALSYAAAGHLIGWVDVVRRGCQIAAQLLEVQTIETAMQFAASQYRDDGTYESFKYGIGSQIILAAVAEFIADRLPALFQLNTTVVDTLGYRRLPYDTPTPDKPVETMQGSPVVVRGTSRGHFSRGSRGQSHPHIQFGDLSLTNGTTGGPSDAPQAPLPEMNAFEAAMSRVLINLPFGQLKWLVETGPHPLLRVFQDVVREREARRARTLETIHSSGSHDLEGLQRPEPPQSNPLVVLGWHEKISFSGSFERPSLRRQWVPLKKDSKNDAKKDNAIQVADYP